MLGLFFLVFSGCTFSFSSPENSKNTNTHNTLPQKVVSTAVEMNQNIAETAENLVVTSSKKSSPLQKLVAQEQQNNADKTAEIVIQSEEKNGEVIATVVLKNPENYTIQSVQAWFVYPTPILQPNRIDMVGRDIFPLFAPGENEFDTTKGIVKIGVSVDGNAKKTEDEMVLARIYFSRISDSPFQFELFPHKVQVLRFTPTGLRNILKIGE